MAAGNTITELKILLASYRANGRISADELDDILNTLSNVIENSDTDSLNLEWAIGTTYDTPDTAKISGNPSYSESGDRLWKSKIDNNTGNEPPVDPEVTEDSYWIEQSKSAASPIQEWQAGPYGAGLIIVFHNDYLVKLNVVNRPFESTDIDAEIEDGDWKIIGEKLIEELFDVQDVALNTGVILLDFKKFRQRIFDTSTAHSANFSLEKDNEDNMVLGSYSFETNTTNVIITLEDGNDGTTEDVMPTDLSSWNDADKELTIAEAGIYELVYRKRGSKYLVTLSDKF